MPENIQRPVVSNPIDEAVQAFLLLSAEAQEELISLLRFLSLPEE